MSITASPQVQRPAPRPHAEYDLVCLSFCGGGTAPFRRWASTLDERTELHIVCYPGRESRFAEPFARHWDELLDDVVAALRRTVQRPYVLFGHSMGASVAFDAVRRLPALGITAPELLVVSGSDTPREPGGRVPGRPMSSDADEELLRWAVGFGQLPPEVLAEPDLQDMVVELLRADLAVLESYRPSSGDQVDVPLQVLYGADDEGDAEAILRRWGTRTTQACHGRILPGGHFYTTEVWNRLPFYLSVPA